MGIDISRRDLLTIATGYLGGAAVGQVFLKSPDSKPAEPKEDQTQKPKTEPQGNEARASDKAEKAPAQSETQRSFLSALMEPESVIGGITGIFLVHNILTDINDELDGLRTAVKKLKKKLEDGLKENEEKALDLFGQLERRINSLNESWEASFQRMDQIITEHSQTIDQKMTQHTANTASTLASYLENEGIVEQLTGLRDKIAEINEAVSMLDTHNTEELAAALAQVKAVEEQVQAVNDKFNSIGLAFLGAEPQDAAATPAEQNTTLAKQSLKEALYELVEDGSFAEIGDFVKANLTEILSSENPVSYFQIIGDRVSVNSPIEKQDYFSEILAPVLMELAKDVENNGSPNAYELLYSIAETKIEVFEALDIDYTIANTKEFSQTLLGIMINEPDIPSKFREEVEAIAKPFDEDIFVNGDHNEVLLEFNEGPHGQQAFEESFVRLIDFLELNQEISDTVQLAPLVFALKSLDFQDMNINCLQAFARYLSIISDIEVDDLIEAYGQDTREVLSCLTTREA